MSTYNEVLVQDVASYPEVAMAAGGIVVITYIKDDVLYMRTSDTGGASWSAAEVVSDNQVNLNNRAANLDEYQGNIIGVWEDTRGDNVDIYYDMIYEAINDPPLAPTITGPNKGNPEVEYDWDFSADDPNGDNVKFFIQWGDTTSEWTGETGSGTPITASHTYAEEGDYTITAKAQDAYGLEGPEKTKTISMPRNRALTNTLFLQFLQQFPNAFPMLRYILGL